MTALEHAVEAGDLDELVRMVDHLCDTGDWNGLVELRDRSRAAVRRGKQLWPAASLAEYRIALDAPGKWAGAVLVEGAGRFALGPLAEVAASTHRWEELAPYLPAGPPAGLAAHERVVRGEDLTGDDRVDATVLDVPLRLEPWEPTYPVATYHPDRAELPPPPAPALRAETVTAAPRPGDDPQAVQALLALVDRWVTESNGRAEAVAVGGDARAAITALGHRHVRLAPVAAADAVALMAWAGASGGAHGRRRGSATGRFGAWWALAAVAGMLDAWPVPSDELGAVANELGWYVWQPDERAVGWHLHLAVEDLDEGLAWALTATDSADA